MSKIPANKIKLFCELPVKSVIQPTSDVLTIPPTLPIELINARPAAAAAPLKKVGGTLQNAAWVVDAAAAATVKINIVIARLSKCSQLKARPAAVIKQGMAVCQRRSLTLSACALFMIETTTASVYILDDTMVSKCRRIVEWFSQRPEWKCIASGTDRNGWAVFERLLV